MSLTTDILFSLIIVACGIWWWRRLYRNDYFYKHIPGPPTIPILGNALDFRNTSDILDAMLRHTKLYGGLVKLQIGPLDKFLLVADYKFLEFALTSTKLLNKSDDYRFARSWLGTGLLTAAEPKWKKHRRILTPAFHFQILEQFIDIFESCGDRLVEKFGKEVGKDHFDVYPFVTLCTLDIICESTMGININAQDDENSDYVSSVKNMCRIIMERSISPLEMCDFLYPLTKNYYLEQKALRILHSHTNSVIMKKQKELKEKTTEANESENLFIKKKKAFLDLLLETKIDGRPLTQEEIRQEVDTFMFAGHDTTAAAISFTLFCLANHPHAQQKALEEQRAIFDDFLNPTVAYTDLQNMKYLEWVIKETLRLYPSVPVFGRKTDEYLEYENLTLPRGDTLLIFPYGLHRNPEYFENPDEFNPDRFENIDGKLPYAYIPFSAGPRNCIGQKFAMLEMKSTISKIIRKFELQPAIPQHILQLRAETVLKSANGIKIRLKLRS